MLVAAVGTPHSSGSTFATSLVVLERLLRVQFASQLGSVTGI
jgi:hypothetical protein